MFRTGDKRRSGPGHVKHGIGKVDLDRSRVRIGSYGIRKINEVDCLVMRSVGFVIVSTSKERFAGALKDALIPTGFARYRQGVLVSITPATVGDKSILQSASETLFR